MATTVAKEDDSLLTVDAEASIIELEEPPPSQPRFRKLFGGIAGMAALLGIVAVLYSRKTPQVQSSHLKGHYLELNVVSNPCATATTSAASPCATGNYPPPQNAAPPFPQYTLNNIMAKAVSMHKKAAKEKGASSDETESVLDKCKVSEDTFDDCAQKNKSVVRDAIDDVAQDFDVEEAADNGMMVTSKMLQKLNGLSDTPENAPGTLEDSTHTLEGDMVVNKNQVGFRRLWAGGRRMWAGNLWPDKHRIPYCFDHNIASSSKTSFLKALTHVTNLIPCLGFKEVGIASSGKCQNYGIYVQSKDSGCYAYVGRTTDNQALNLSPHGCTHMAIAAHELLHALGVTHEQSRTDYTKYIQIYWQNIKPSQRHNYDTEKGADVSLDYDIMSLMHYGDTDFGINGATTMKALGNHRGVMGQRMGLSKYDAQQLGLMYQCEYKKFELCTNDPKKCTYSDCICHADGGDSPLIKTISANGCKRCERQCPAHNSGSCLATACGCGAGFKKVPLQMSGGGTCYACKEGAPPPPSPPPPPPAPPPALAPCQFPTRASSCDKGAMPGCTSCDGDNPWCFTAAKSGKWRYCTKEDKACVLPFKYNGKDYYTCTADGEANGKPWCYKYGGGWKHCGTADGFDVSLTPSPPPPPPPPAPPPTPPPAPPPTPAPPPAGCSFPFSYGQHSLSGACLKHNEKHYCKDHGNAWRYCDDADANLCSFPFDYSGVKHWNCLPYNGRTWCPKVGGGWKYC